MEVHGGFVDGYMYWIEFFLVDLIGKGEKLDDGLCRKIRTPILVLYGLCTGVLLDHACASFL
jgi:hypothetical protein